MAGTMDVLLVEDDPRIARVVERALTDVGHRVEVARDGLEGVTSAERGGHDLFVLDVMLPEMDGMEVAREMRRQHLRTPILMLTARDAVPDRVRGLDAGADDYLTKPFALEELLARLRALGRRHLSDRSSVIEMGGIRLDTAARTVSVGGSPVPLRAKELAVLEYFIHQPGRLLTKAQIEDHVWNYDFAAESNLVEAYIARIRRKLIAAGADDPFTTVRGSGYRLEVRPWADSSREPASA